MKKQYIIEMEETDHEHICKVVNGLKGKATPPEDWQAIANGTPYNPTGDLISREALKDITYINKGNFNTVEGIREWIDNAQAIPLPNEQIAWEQGFVNINKPLSEEG